jgi:hypothetical protein
MKPHTSTFLLHSCRFAYHLFDSVSPHSTPLCISRVLPAFEFKQQSMMCMFLLLLKILFLLCSECATTIKYINITYSPPLIKTKLFNSRGCEEYVPNPLTGVGAVNYHSSISRRDIMVPKSIIFGAAERYPPGCSLKQS